ncbi:hypothetical protein N7463_007329 [Penicillium fimorum]|uniref:Uncharacterized protein n=1 Tax=Penicillium fimorum TaxID=1882269 RepID=A0A9X0C7G7_9EURO|nr:hypothetical protein N7463_007329 [Penicillium fimorum]
MIGNKAEIEGYLQVPLRFAFKWIDAPYYTTDLSVYVFQPYGKPPQVKTLDVILTSMEYEQLRRAIIVVNSHNTLADLRRDFLPQVFQQDVAGLSYIMQLFRIVCAKITDELVTFLTKACDDINYMVSAAISDSTPCAQTNLFRPMKDGFVPLEARCNIFGT